MNILFIVPFYPTKYAEWGGIFFHNYARGLVKNGHNVTVIRVGAHNRYEIKERKKLFIRDSEFRDNVRIEIFFFPKFPKFDFITQRFLRFFQIYIFKNTYKDKKPDIAHIHFSEFDTSYQASLWLKKFNIPYIVTEHSTSFLENSLNKKSLKYSIHVFKYAKAITSVGKNLNYSINKITGFNSEIIPNCIDPELFFYKPQKNNDYINFITAAVLVEKKNHKLLVRSFFKAFKGNPKYHLTIIGEGVERKSIEEEISKFNVEHIVKLPGKATNIEIRNAFQNSDYFVLPSRIETFGVVVLEALCCGLPVLITDCGGPSDFVRPNIDGLIVPINEDEIAQGLIKLTQINWDRALISEYFIKNYSISNIGNKLTSLYEKVLFK